MMMMERELASPFWAINCDFYADRRPFYTYVAPNTILNATNFKLNISLTQFFFLLHSTQRRLRVRCSRKTAWKLTENKKYAVTTHECNRLIANTWRQWETKHQNDLVNALCLCHLVFFAFRRILLWSDVFEEENYVYVWIWIRGISTTAATSAIKIYHQQRRRCIICSKLKIFILHFTSVLLIWWLFLEKRRCSSATTAKKAVVSVVLVMTGTWFSVISFRSFFANLFRSLSALVGRIQLTICIRMLNQTSMFCLFHSINWHQLENGIYIFCCRCSKAVDSNRNSVHNERFSIEPGNVGFFT